MRCEYMTKGGCSGPLWKVIIQYEGVEVEHLILCASHAHRVEQSALRQSDVVRVERTRLEREKGAAPVPQHVRDIEVEREMRAVRRELGDLDDWDSEEAKRLMAQLDALKERL